MNICKKHGDENMVRIAHKIYYRCRVCATEARALARYRKKGLPESHRPPTQDQIANRVYNVTLLCGHTAIYKISAPLVGDVLYCRSCVDYQSVEMVVIKQKGVT